MIVFTAGQRQALRQLAELWSDTKFCLIGASALSCQLDLDRQTDDLDVSVSVSLDQLTARLQLLHEWKRHPRKEHEWSSPAGIRVDVIPAGPSLLESGEIVWPGSGARMKLTGLRLALENAIAFEVEPGFSIPVAPIAVVAVLKMISYQDRPGERQRDLYDLARILENYVSLDDDRRFAPAVLDASVPYEHASSYLPATSVKRRLDSADRYPRSDSVSWRPVLMAHTPPCGVLQEQAPCYAEGTTDDRGTAR